VGLGNIGGQVPRIGLAFGMKIIAWSKNMTPEIAEAAGAAVAAARELLIGNAIGGLSEGKYQRIQGRSRPNSGPPRYHLITRRPEALLRKLVHIDDRCGSCACRSSIGSAIAGKT
jgi:hypothetical protein